jgi:cellobiose-specific phosphotransferase system component IIC
MFVNLVIVLLTPVVLSLSALIGRGELLMLSVGLSAGAIADVWSTRSAGRLGTFAVLACLVCALGATIVYTVLTVANRFDIPVNKEVAAIVSLFPYALSVFVSAGCIVVVERRGRSR